MFRNAILAASALALATSAATAAQAATETGPYVGVAATVDATNADLGVVDSLGATGVGASAFAGYTIALGNGLFVAPEANIDLNSVEAKVADGTDVLRAKARWGWGVGARVGYDLSDSTAGYLRAGYARNQIKVVTNGIADKAWGDGVRVGGGVETRLAPQLRLRAEYNYVNYEKGVSNNQGLVGLVYGF